MKLKNLIAISTVALSSCVAQPAFAQLHVVRQQSLDKVQGFSETLGKVFAEQGEEKAIEAGSDSVRGMLKDPSSAMFRNLKVQPYLNGHVLCGEYNAKNSYGGYVGFKPFVAGLSTAALWYNGPSPSVNAEANIGIRQACGY